MTKILDYLYRSFEKKPVVVSKNQRILTLILRHNIRFLSERSERVYIMDLWGFFERSLRETDLFEEYLEKIVLGTGRPLVIISPSERLHRYRDHLIEASSLYTDSSGSILRSLGFDPVLKIFATLRPNTYILRSSDNTNIVFRVDEKLDIHDLGFSERYSEVLRVLSEAFEVYGAYKQSDAVKILMRELGLDRLEAQRIIRDLYEKGLIKIDKGGYIDINP